MGGVRAPEMVARRVSTVERTGPIPDPNDRCRGRFCHVGADCVVDRVAKRCSLILLAILRWERPHCRRRRTSTDHSDAVYRRSGTCSTGACTGFPPLGHARFAVGRVHAAVAAADAPRRRRNASAPLHRPFPNKKDAAPPGNGVLATSRYHASDPPNT